jgi:hypothetical protein
VKRWQWRVLERVEGAGMLELSTTCCGTEVWLGSSVAIGHVRGVDVGFPSSALCCHHSRVPRMATQPLHKQPVPTSTLTIEKVNGHRFWSFPIAKLQHRNTTWKEWLQQSRLKKNICVQGNEQSWCGRCRGIRC